MCWVLAIVLWALLLAAAVCPAALPTDRVTLTTGTIATPRPQEEAELEPGLLAPARSALADGQPGHALELAEAARRAGADRVQVVLLKAAIYAQMQNTERQREMLQAAIALDESLCQPRLLLASIEEQRGLWQRAAELYEEAIAQNSSCRNAYLRLAHLYEQHNRPMRSLNILQQGVAANPNDIVLLLALGDTCRERNLLELAETAYGRLVVQGDKPTQALAYQHLGSMYTEVGQFSEAFDCYVQAEELLDNPGRVAAAGYRKIFSAADGAIQDTLKNVWQLFTAFIEGGPVAREEAYLALTEGAAEIGRIKQFGEQVQPPAGLREVHAQRQLFYAVAHEAVVTAQIYLDTGDTNLLTTAQQRRAQADQERQHITEPGGAGRG